MLTREGKIPSAAICSPASGIRSRIAPRMPKQWIDVFWRSTPAPIKFVANQTDRFNCNTDRARRVCVRRRPECHGARHRTKSGTQYCHSFHHRSALPLLCWFKVRNPKSPAYLRISDGTF